MLLDLEKLKKQTSSDVYISPIDLFSLLPEKNKKYDYLRSIQNHVLSQWYDDSNRKNKDTIIKMNTGSGKTIIGLLILYSSLKEGVGPAVYVVPDDYIKEQVKKEADGLGIPNTFEPENTDFQRSRAILIINIQTLINGKSKFGMRREYHRNIKIGAIVIDDVHSALNITDKQFSISIPRSSKIYSDIFNLFSESIKKQIYSHYLEIKEDRAYREIFVPFWTLQEKHNNLMEILHRNSEDPLLEFSYPFYEKYSRLSKMIITSKNIEIAPVVPPIEAIGSFHSATRRIFMSATLADDTSFVTNFGVDFEKTKIITPEFANDIGERMILTPQLINPNINDMEMREKIHQISKNINVIVIVPSKYKSELWKSYATNIIDKGNIHDAVDKIKVSSKHGLYVFINRYDGIDLPDDSCRMVVLDDLPDTFTPFDIYEEGILQGGMRIKNLYIQKIEQGMGRGVRGSLDYCGIVLMGKKLLNSIYSEGAFKLFSKATQKQLELSNAITEQLKDQNINQIFNAFEYLYSRDRDWVELCKSNILKIEYDNVANLNEIEVVIKKANDFAMIEDYSKSVQILSDFINKEDDNALKGWAMQLMAMYLNFNNPVEAQNTLKAGKRINVRLLNPIDGISTDRERKKFTVQADRIIEFCNKNNMDENKYLLHIKALIEDLQFMPDSSNKFEEAIKKLGFALGFESSRPEKDEGKGPDNLWRILEQEYIVIECKNETITHTINKHDCNQLNGSIEWFEQNYQDCRFTPIMIHNSDQFEYSCTPNRNIRIMTPDLLLKFVNNFECFATTCSKSSLLSNRIQLSQVLAYNKLFPTDIIKEYTSEYREV